jgi:hypothetical protein
VIDRSDGVTVHNWNVGNVLVVATTDGIEFMEDYRKVSRKR